ncbi:MAG: signal recognition particle-docking protein FtsY [Bdellovibrio sp.]|nr:signal recognition particle-docking protein FtsY [Bdellovibrio sp.]
MSEAHSNQMLYLLIFVGVLLMVIVGTIAFSQLKKKKPIELAETPKQPFKVASSEEKELVSVQTPALAPKLTLVEPEVETNLKQALKKTEESFFGRIKKAFSNQDKKIVLEQIEEVLYTSDLGPTTVQKLLAVVEEELSSKEFSDLNAVKAALKKQMLEILKPYYIENYANKKVSELLTTANDGPTVLMVVGVNGAGKTTSIGKMTAQLAGQGKKVLVAAGDTFRAAAGGQLKAWTERAQGAIDEGGSVEIYWPENTKDPSAVAFDAITKAKGQNYDYVILDTAGRLHTQSHLMDELKKVKRVMAKVMPEAPHDTWIVLDANSGQNALLQAKEFHQALGLSGVILTKMDGTAKGGVALGVVDQLQIPIKLVGIGEKINDLKSFDYQEYVDSILG